MSTSTVDIIQSLLLADQIDRLHISLGALLDMIAEGELDLVLDNNEKSPAQKKLYVQKIIDQVSDPLLAKMLKEKLDEGDMEFFGQKFLKTFVEDLQQQAEGIHLVGLQVAVNFKEQDLREMANLLSKKMGFQVAFNLKVDRNLIGGAIIQHGSYLSDYSLRTKLNLFREDWHEAVLDEPKKKAETKETKEVKEIKEVAK